MIKSVTAISFLLLCLIYTGCTKSAAESLYSLNSSASSDTVSRSININGTGSTIISPGNFDKDVDVNTAIVVRCNTSRHAESLYISELTLRKGTIIVDGLIERTDTSVTFTPNVNLDKHTTYIVELKGTATFGSNEGMESHAESLHDRWSFTTSAYDPEYIMTRQTQTLTAFARDGSKMMQMGEYLYLYGGWTGTDTSSTSWNDVYRSEGDLSTWTSLPNAPWSGRHIFGVGKLRSELFVFGGDQHTDVFDVWKSRDGENFSPVANDLANTVTRRLIYGACAHNNMLYVMGGQSNTDNLDAGLTDVWSSANGLVWKKIADGKTFLGKNLSGSVASFNGKIWVIGGGYYGHPDSSLRWTNHIYSSPDGISWTRQKDAPWVGRQFADVCVWDNKLWMVGGSNGKNLADIWYMNKDETWVQYTPSNLFTARHATAVAAYNDNLVIACGDLNNECWIIRKN